MLTHDKDVIDRLEQLFLLDDAASGKPAQKSTLNSFWLGVGITSLVAGSFYLFTHGVPSLDVLTKEFNKIGIIGRTPVKPVTPIIPGVTQKTAPGLSATRTTLTGIVDPESLTAAYYLSTVFKNSTAVNQQAQMNIMLPAGAVVTRATLWINGQPQEAAFTESGKAQAAFDWVNQGRRDPLLVKQVDARTIQVVASPVVPGGDGMKIRIGITAPVRLLPAGEVAADLPTIAERNFSDGTFDVHLESTNAFVAGSDSVKQEGAAQVLRRHVPSLSEPMRPITLSRRSAQSSFATRATHSLDGGFIVATATTNPKTSQLDISLKKQLAKPAADVPIIAAADAAARVNTLWAHSEILNALAHDDTYQAQELANVYRVVSPVSSAVVLEGQSDYDHWGLNRDLWRSMNHVQRDKNGNFDATKWYSGSPAIEPIVENPVLVPQPEIQSVPTSDGLRPTPLLAPPHPEMQPNHRPFPLPGAALSLSRKNTSTAESSRRADKEAPVPNASAAPLSSPVLRPAPMPVTPRFSSSELSDPPLLRNKSTSATSDQPSLQQLDAAKVATNTSMAMAILCLIPLLMLGVLNWAPVAMLFGRAAKRAAARRTGSEKLFALGAIWLCLAVTMPVISQVLAAIVVLLLVKRRSRQRLASKLVSTNGPTI